MFKNQKGFGHVELILVFIVIGLIGTITNVVMHGREASPVKANVESVKQANVEETKSSKTADHEKAEQAVIAAPTPVVSDDPNTEANLSKRAAVKPTISFVDTATWQTLSPKDGAYSVKYAPHYVNGYCKDIASSLLVAMSFVGAGDEYTCNSLKEAVSATPVTPGATDGFRLLSRRAIGPTATMWDRGAAEPMSVKLADGTPAERYDYTHTIDNFPYRTIEYVMRSNGKSYTAVMHWGTHSDPNSRHSSSLSPTEISQFDTMVQKTLKFK